MREQIWKFATAKQQEGMILPGWLIVIKAILFPLDFFFWKMNKTRGYQFDRDVWIIDGMVWSGTALRMLGDAQGETYRITRSGDCVTLERVDSER
jgi:hypothetical protein